MKVTYKYHHIGIPTQIPREDETYIAKFKIYTSGYESSPYGVEWLRFEPDSPMPELIRTVPHVAFEVTNLQEALKGKKILINPNSPSKGVMVAFIVDDGAPIEFLKIDHHAD